MPQPTQLGPAHALRSLLVAIALGAGISYLAQAAQQSIRPNIIFILTDDFGYGDLGSYGGKAVPTPNLDRLAKEGIRFTQFYVASPICSPSRVACTTGVFPARWRITSYLQTRKGNASCEQADFLDPKAPSLARLLKSSGYATAHIGKWHMGGGRDVTNAPSILAYGFDECVSTWESPNPHPDITATNWIWSPQDKVKRWERTSFFVDKTLDFIRRHPGQPCYINLWPDDTHTPFVPSPEAKARLGSGSNPGGPRNFHGVLEEYDRQMGRLVEGLNKLGVGTNTLLIFTGDNGPLPTFDHQRTGGLRGSKLSLYEGGIRQPLIVRCPGRVAAGAVNQVTVMSTVDLLPSLCAIAGVAVPAHIKAALDGEDLSAAFLGATPRRHKPLFWEYGRNTNSFVFPNSVNDRSPNVAVRDGDWKLLQSQDGTGAQLYNVVSDPFEHTDWAKQKPELVKDLSARALQWRQSLP